MNHLTAAALAAALLAGACRAPVRIDELPEERTASGLALLDLRVGRGIAVGAGARVTVHYVGRFADGTPFDSSYDRGSPLTFTVGAGEVIAGWDQGMLGMRVGGQRRIVIPPDQGLTGELGAGDQPLELEVELLAAAPP